MLILGLTVTFASVDWVMSLDPHWFSTIFGLWFLIGMALTALAFSIVVAALLHNNSHVAKALSTDRFHDYGTLLYAFIMLWAYLAYSQFLIVWSANLPEPCSALLLAGGASLPPAGGGVFERYARDGRPHGKERIGGVGARAGAAHLYRPEILAATAQRREKPVEVRDMVNLPDAPQRLLRVRVRRFRTMPMGTVVPWTSLSDPAAKQTGQLLFEKYFARRHGRFRRAISPDGMESGQRPRRSARPTFHDDR